MTYLVINTNRETLGNEIIKIVNKLIKTEVKSLNEIIDKPDFYILTPKEKASITIEQAKGFQKKLIFPPIQHKYQFGVILNAELMTEEAQNSLLKTFEEKKEHTIIILGVKNEKTVLDTIVSRSTKIYPKVKNIKGEEKTKDEYIDFIEMPIYKKIPYVEKIIKDEIIEEFLNNLLLHYRNEYKNKIKQNKSYKDEITNIKIIEDVRFKISKNVNKKIALEYLCFKTDWGED